MAEKSERQLSRVYGYLHDCVEQELTQKVGKYGLWDLQIRPEIDQALSGYLEVIMQDEKIKNRLVKQASRAILKRQQEKERAERKRHARDKKLWQLTKGKIPCINQCGYHDQRTKDEVMEGFNTFLCGECAKKAEVEGRSISDIVDGKTVYDLFGIK